MTKKWLQWISLSFAVTALLLFSVGTFIALGRPNNIEVLEQSISKAELPKPVFLQPKGNYDLIGAHVLKLATTPRSLQLPDLRHVLVFHGKNQRPDADINTCAMHFSIAGTKDATAIMPNTKIYLVYDRTQNPPRYLFSPNNAKTALWFEAQPYGAGVNVKVGMHNEKNELLTSPAAHARFQLALKPLLRNEVSAPDLGGFRLDGTLLARQKARWCGLDRFFERHGGKEYETCFGRQRIDFGEGDNAYSVFVQLGDVLVWKDNAWDNATLGEETIGLPILCVTRVDDRLMTFELWDAEGKLKTTLNLLKSLEPAPAGTVLQGLKFVGSKTRSQFVFEFNKKRMTLSPNDWLLIEDKTVKPLATPADIDAYVDRKLIGFLFVFDAVQKHDDRQYIVGTLFNKARTEILPIEILMQPGEVAIAKSPGKPKPEPQVKAPNFQGQNSPINNAGQPANNADDDSDDSDDDDYDDDDDDDDDIKPGTPNAIRSR